jgi:hypothetical protein
MLAAKSGAAALVPPIETKPPGWQRGSRFVPPTAVT